MGRSDKEPVYGLGGTGATTGIQVQVHYGGVHGLRETTPLGDQGTYVRPGHRDCRRLAISGIGDGVSGHIGRGPDNAPVDRDPIGIQVSSRAESTMKSKENSVTPSE